MITIIIIVSSTHCFHCFHCDWMNVFPGPESRLRSKTVLYIITINIIVIVQNPYLRIILTSLIDNCLIVWLFWISFKESLFQRAEPPISGLFWHLWLFDFILFWILFKEVLYYRAELRIILTPLFVWLFWILFKDAFSPQLFQRAQALSQDYFDTFDCLIILKIIQQVFILQFFQGLFWHLLFDCSEYYSKRYYSNELKPYPKIILTPLIVCRGGSRPGPYVFADNRQNFLTEPPHHHSHQTHYPQI